MLRVFSERKVINFQTFRTIKRTCTMYIVHIVCINALKVTKLTGFSEYSFYVNANAFLMRIHKIEI